MPKFEIKSKFGDYRVKIIIKSQKWEKKLGEKQSKFWDVKVKIQDKVKICDVEVKLVWYLSKILR